MTCESEGQHSSAQLTSEEDTKDEDDQTSGDRGNARKPDERALNTSAKKHPAEMGTAPIPYL